MKMNVFFIFAMLIYVTLGEDYNTSTTTEWEDFNTSTTSFFYSSMNYTNETYYPPPDIGENVTLPECGKASLTKSNSYIDLIVCVDGDYVTVSVTFDATRWCGIGFTAELDTSNPMTNVYTLIVEDEDVLERRLGPGNSGKLLVPMIKVLNDYYDEDEGRRRIDLKRKITITQDDVNASPYAGNGPGNGRYDDNAENYYDFANVLDCDDTVNIIYATAGTDYCNVGPGQCKHSQSTKGTASMSVETSNGVECGDIDSGDNANTLSFFINAAVSIIFMLLVAN